ncbi:extensin family protein [Caulobacter zeae]|uniref:Extensin family protein n=1 Tax=Caulobacter zeae TaxID=2055137 RepID=A0A2N5DP94_9CAUL|nr:extensin family protein [Caulobacter zeae]PLR27881.1 extensin family protein [Caulobacter zeae]
MKPASPQALALAEIGGLLLDAALVGLLVFALVDRIAPPQDLAWKPFSIDQPLGLATQAKLARIGADPAACRAALRDVGITPVDQPVREDGFCSTRDTVRAQSRLSPAAPVMTCPLALRYAVWERQVLDPAAEHLLDSDLVRVEHLGTYACRTIYGREGERPSQHASASALDVSGVRLADGRRLTIAADFHKDSPEGRFLRVARAGACELFGAVLGPDYNTAHADHLHLDLSPYRLCR